MFIRIADQIFDEYPHFILGIVIAHQVDNASDNPEITQLLRSEEEKLRDRLADITIVEHPHISPWRDAYRRFGAKPKKYRSSIENLVRRTIKGRQLPHINNLVAIYNTISLRYVMPVGGEDLDRIAGDVWLTTAAENEAPIRLLGEKDERPPYPDEVIYKDDIGTICRRWNWKEADRTKLMPGTQNAIIVIERLPPVGETVIEEAINDCAMLVGQYCGGTVTTAFLNKDAPQKSLLL